ncbi:MAG: hypothetical protein GY898_13080 [Proteobacteria bacterium]|nr:hypothetical protein [Pseudomonadota bacterium]
MFIGSTERGGNGVTGIWRHDGKEPNLVQTIDAAYVTELREWDGSLWAATSDGWKYDTGNAQLLRSDDGTAWENVCTLPELAAWSIAVAGGSLYLGSWEFEVGGTVYEVRVQD